MPLPYELYLALRYLRVHRGRTFLSVITVISVAGVTVGTAALVIALSLMAGFVEDVRGRIHGGGAQLTVLGADQDLFSGGAALVRRLESIAGVRAAACVLYTEAIVTVDERGQHGYLELHGVDPAAQARIVHGSEAEEPPFQRLAAPTASGRPGILLGEQLASRLHAVEGESVRVVVPEVRLAPWGALPRSQVFEVVGRYRSNHFQEDAQRAYTDLESARRLVGAADGTRWVEVRLDDPSQLGPMKECLKGELGQSWLVVDLLEANQDLLKALNTEKLVLFLAIGLIVVVAALNIVSTLLLMVSDKIRDIGTLSAMGARPSGIARVFILQGVIIGVVGTVAGLALGVTACWWLDRYQVIRLNPEIYYLNYIPFAVQPRDLLFVGAAALLISVLATLYPSLKAAGLDPVEAIRHE